MTTSKVVESWFKMQDKKKKFMVLDVEGQATCQPYDIGYIIGDKEGNVKRRRSFALLEFMPINAEHSKKIEVCKLMTSVNHEAILLDKNQIKWKKVTREQFIKIFFQDIEDFDIGEIWAANVKFDKGSLSRLLTNEEYGFLCKKVEFMDILEAITQTRLLTQKYLKFCKENKFLTDKGNFQYKVEVVYRYLTNNVNFVEEHTGLSDVMVEYDILRVAMKSGKKYREKLQSPIWKILKDFAIEKGVI